MITGALGVMVKLEERNLLFHVWMRTAALPTFRKLYGVQQNLVPAGTYELNITQNFDVNRFGGTKSIVLSTTSILGGKNIFLGSAYVIVGTLCIVFAVAFLIRNMVNPRYFLINFENSVIINYSLGIKKLNQIRILCFKTNNLWLINLNCYGSC